MPVVHTVNSAKNPRWSNATKTWIDLDVDFNELDADFVPFTASADTDTDYGRDLFARAIAGEFGTIADYVAPPEPVYPVATIGNVVVLISRPTFETIREAAMNAVALGETNVTFAYGDVTVTGTLTEARAAMRTFLG